MCMNNIKSLVPFLVLVTVLESLLVGADLSTYRGFQLGPR